MPTPVIKPSIAVAVLFAFTFFCASVLHAASLEVDVHKAGLEGRGEKIGTVKIEETQYGLVFTPALEGLSSGGHGFHIHANGDCGPAPDATTGKMIPAGAAGGHFDPEDTKTHGLPWEANSHLGDLPLLYVNAQGRAETPVLAPRLKTLDQIRGRALMIHEGGDNYSDHPKPLGGGGGRIACGIIK